MDCCGFGLGGIHRRCPSTKYYQRFLASVGLIGFLWIGGLPGGPPHTLHEPGALVATGKLDTDWDHVVRTGLYVGIDSIYGTQYI